MHTFTGDAHARGYQHGVDLAEAIRTRVRTSLPGDLDETQRARLAQPWIDASEELDTDMVREMSGIAAGAGTTLADVVLLNSFEAFQLAEMVERGGCTAIAVAAKGRTLLAQNWDANAQLASGLSIHLHRDPEAADVAVLASPGGLGWVGMNECGLGLVNNDLLGGPTASTAPSQVIRRVVLKHADTTSALSAMQTVGHPALRSYLLADATGTLTGVEVLPDQPPATITPSAGGLVHANHAVTPHAQMIEDKNLQQSVYPSSEHRAERAAELLELTSQDVDGHDRLLSVLRDHDGSPLSICRHASPDEATCTAASVIFDCTNRQAEFTLGLACAPHGHVTVDFTAYDTRD